MKPIRKWPSVAYFVLSVGCISLKAIEGSSSSELTSADSKQGASLSVTQAVENISLIEDIPPKRRQHHTDQHAAAIVSFGKQAGPLLVDKILNDKPSKYFYAFQFTIGDIADSLLVDIYGQDPSSTLIRRKPPVDPTQGYMYYDYVALVSSRKGREELQAAWRKVVDEAKSKDTTAARE